MIDYEETKEDAILSFEQQIKQLVKDAFDKGYQCGYKDRKGKPQKGEWIVNISDYKSVCSVCGANETEFIYGTEMWYGLGKSKFCPNCGARMKGAGNEGHNI